MTTPPLFNYVPQREVIRGRNCRQGGVVGFTLLQLYHHRESAWYPLAIQLSGSTPTWMLRRETFLAMSGIKLCFLCYPVHSPHCTHCSHVWMDTHKWDDWISIYYGHTVQLLLTSYGIWDCVVRMSTRISEKCATSIFRLKNQSSTLHTCFSLGWFSTLKTEVMHSSESRFTCKLHGTISQKVPALITTAVRSWNPI
jgi:hypothetical protein